MCVRWSAATSARSSAPAVGVHLLLAAVCNMCCAVLCCAVLCAVLCQVDKGLNVLEFHEKPPRQQLATMSIDTLEYGFGEQ